MLDRKTIARQNITRWMKEQEISQAELSRRMGISYQYVWRILKSDRSLGPVNEERIVLAFGLKSIAEIYRDPTEVNPMFDRLLDKEAKLINGDNYKLEIIEKLVDLLQDAPHDVADHINRQLDLLKKLK